MILGFKHLLVKGAVNLRYRTEMPEALPQARFGVHVAIGGGALLVGADDGGEGTVNVYELATGDHVRTLASPNLGIVPSEYFGLSGAIEGEVAAVGAFNSAAPGVASAGRVYVFNGQKHVRTFQSPDPEAAEQFGCSVALAGNRVVVGAHRKDSLRGAAYVFDLGRRGGEGKKLVDPLGSPGDLFGWGVAVAGDLLAVTAPQGIVEEANAGKAVIFHLPSGKVVTHLSAGQPGGSAAFGAAMAFEPGLLVVGAPGQAVQNADWAGAVYVYRNDDFQNPQIIEAPNPHQETLFGESVAVGSNLFAVTAAPRDDLNVGTPRKVYLYDRDTGKLQYQILSPKKDSQNGFAKNWWGVAHVLAMNGATLAVGAPDEDAIAGWKMAGATYVFEIDTLAMKLPVQIFAHPKFFVQPQQVPLAPVVG